MALSASHQRLRDALTDAGWRIEQDALLGTGPGGNNPFRISIARGRIKRVAVVYAWSITGEGVGPGRGDNFRVQSTRGHEGDFMVLPGHLAIGVGWHEEYRVFGAFDVWVKRTTGRSSSVHLHRWLLEDASANEWQEDLREDGPTCAWQPERIGRYLQWLLALNQRRAIAVEPEEHQVTDDRLILRIDPRRKPFHYFALRPDDHIILRQGTTLLDECVWKVLTVETDRQASGGGSNKPFLDIACKRHGIVRDASWFN